MNSLLRSSFLQACHSRFVFSKPLSTSLEAARVLSTSPHLPSVNSLKISNASHLKSSISLQVGEKTVKLPISTSTESFSVARRALFPTQNQHLFYPLQNKRDFSTEQPKGPSVTDSQTTTVTVGGSFQGDMHVNPKKGGTAVIALLVGAVGLGLVATMYQCRNSDQQFCIWLRSITGQSSGIDSEKKK